ncbi:Uncharacterized 22.5 kDa protein in cps region [Burkholderiales bacterium 8X]|nr:Uncharacterized 22.5 kDa protein in cps region [Burkholderiales bacterium 8X]
MYSLPLEWWHAVTWLGDSALLLPMAVWIVVWLGTWRPTRSVAVLWVLLFGGGSAIVLVSKLAFMGWGIGSATLNFTGISGHTMLSASIWPVALWLTASKFGHRWRVAAAAVGSALAVVIGLSRLAIYAHSKSEVAAGLVLGLLVSGAFLLLQHRRPHPRLNWSLVVFSLATPMLFVKPGTKAPTHGLLEQIAVQMSGAERPYTREDLLRRRSGSAGSDGSDGSGIG